MNECVLPFIIHLFLHAYLYQWCDFGSFDVIIHVMLNFYISLVPFFLLCIFLMGSFGVIIPLQWFLDAALIILQQIIPFQWFLLPASIVFHLILCFNHSFPPCFIGSFILYQFQWYDIDSFDVIIHSMLYQLYIPLVLSTPADGTPFSVNA